MWLLKAAQVRSYEIRYSFDSGCLADSPYNTRRIICHVSAPDLIATAWLLELQLENTHQVLLMAGMHQTLFSSVVFEPAPVSWRYTRSAHKNHGHSAHQDLYPSQQWHRHFQTCLDHPIAWPFCGYFPTSPRMKLSQWFHCKAHHTGYMTDHGV